MQLYCVLCPMAKNVSLQPLFKFLIVATLHEQHWLYGLVNTWLNVYFIKSNKLGDVMKCAHFFSIICNEVTTLDIHSWNLINAYTIDQWT